MDYRAQQRCRGRRSGVAQAAKPSIVELVLERDPGVSECLQAACAAPVVLFGRVVRVVIGAASCVLEERLVCGACFELFPWANSATAMAKRQNTDAVKTRRLKKADFEVDFFFMI